MGGRWLNGSQKIPLMVPSLPDASYLLPYLKEIDKSSHYTNFGPLVRKFEYKLAAFHKAASQSRELRYYRF